MGPIENYFHRFRPIPRQRKDDWRQLGRFKALARREQWSDDERTEEWGNLQQAWTEVVEPEFEGSSIHHYQQLCDDLEIYPIPETVAECKHELKAVFVNIVDLVHYRKCGRKGPKAKRFAQLKLLRKYSREEKKCYPKESAKAEMLKVLLRVLF